MRHEAGAYEAVMGASWFMRSALLEIGPQTSSTAVIARCTFNASGSSSAEFSQIAFSQLSHSASFALRTCGPSPTIPTSVRDETCTLMRTSKMA